MLKSYFILGVGGVCDGEGIQLTSKERFDSLAIIIWVKNSITVTMTMNLSKK